MFCLAPEKQVCPWCGKGIFSKTNNGCFNMVTFKCGMMVTQNTLAIDKPHGLTFSFPRNYFGIVGEQKKEIHRYKYFGPKKFVKFFREFRNWS